MKKVIIFLLFSTILFTACSVKGANNLETSSSDRINESTDEANVEKDNNTHDKSMVNEDIQNSEDNTKENASNGNIISNKNKYLDELNKLEVDLNSSLKEKYDSGITLEMLEAASKEYEQWDYMLNDIYSHLNEILSLKEMDKLTDEQLNWITLRDKKAKEAANEFEGGSFAPVNQLLSLKTTTKERCYELVNLYME